MNQKVGMWAELMRGAIPYRGTPPLGRIYRDPTLVEMLSLSSWWKFVAETIGLLAVLVLLQFQVLKGNASAAGMPHLYWIPIVLISSQYGVLGGMFATIAATAVFFIVDMPLQSAALDFYAYAGSVAGQPAAWLATALILGGLRSLHIRHSYDLEEQLQVSGTVIDSLSEGLEVAIAEVRNLERRIAADTHSVAAVSRSLARIDMTHRRAAAVSCADLVCHTVGASNFAIYLVEHGEFEPVHAADGGLALPVSTLPPIDTSLIRALSAADGVVDAVLTSPITGERASVIAALARHGNRGDALAAVLCETRGSPQSIAVARRRLEDFARTLGAILSGCPPMEQGAHGGD